MKVLIGFDGSEGAHDGVELARCLSAGEEGEALLVNVLPDPGPLPAVFYTRADEDAESAAELFERPAAALAPLEVRWRSHAGGSPAHVLTDLAEAEGFDLIVIGSPRRGPVGRALIGSVARGVLNGAPAPVAVAPRGYADQRHETPRRLAVAYDGSAESQLALEHAESLARRYGARLELLTVATVPPPTPTLVGFRFDPQRTPAEVVEQGLAAVGEGVEVEARELNARSVVSGLVEAADGVDLLLVGSRGYGGLGRVLVGSVAAELIQRAPCPVLVVPRPAPGGGG